MPPRSHRCRRAVTAAMFLAAAATGLAHAATITVTSGADSGPGSLRQAVNDAQPGDTIDFDLTYPATVGVVRPPLVLWKDVTIIGPGADKLTIESTGAATVPVLDIDRPVAVSISGVRMRYAGSRFIRLSQGSLALRDCVVVDNLGIAVLAWGDLSVDNCVFAGNQTAHENESGAAIYLVEGVATISHSTFHDNTASGSCGAVRNRGTMTIRNSTFSDNKTFGTPGSQGGALCGEGPLTVEDSTFTGNYARFAGGAIASAGGSVSGSTFYGNIAGVDGDSVLGGDQLVIRRSIVENCRNASVSAGDNLVDDASCFPASLESNDRVGLDPLLDALADNGGATATMALQAGSPAADAVIVNAGDCGGADQRGHARPAGRRCDIGAFEQASDYLFADGFDVAPLRR